jgi:hypothetical protein
MSSLQHWLRWGAASIALLNLVAMVSLVVAYAWHHGLKPRIAQRRTRQHRFERLLTQSRVDNLDRTESSNAGPRWEW